MEEDAAEVPAPVEELSENPVSVAEFDQASDVNKDDQEEDKQSTEGIAEEGRELTEEELAKLEQAKRKQRREEKRKANLKLKSHYQEQEPQEKQSDAKVAAEPSTELALEPEDQTLPETEAEQNLRSTLSGMTQAATEMQTEIKGGVEEHDDEDIKSPQLSSSDEDAYKQKELKDSFKTDFLEHFYFPSLSDISTESSIVVISQRATKVEERDMSKVDIGHFVDPLTGEELPQEEIVPATTQETAEEEVEEEESSSSISFDWPFPLDDEPVAAQQVDATEFAMEMLMEIHSPTHVVSAVSVTQLEAERVVRENRQIAVDFLFNLINEVVELAEYVDPAQILAERLDKSKLLTELHQLLSKHSSAKQYNSDLNKKMFEYYRRVGQLRGFDALPTSVDLIEYRRLKEGIEHLDHLRYKAAETKALNNKLMDMVTMDLTHASNVALFTFEALEARIRNTIARKDCEILPRIVESELRRMQIMRNEISDSRLWLITRQHTLGRLIERKRHFDQITTELTMDQFLNAQRDVTALGTKVEERNHELIRMRDRCSKHVNQLAFIREKTSMLSANLETKRFELRKKMNRQSDLRDEVFRLKIQHAQLKSQKLFLQSKSGLLHKPALLFDFDKTVEFIETKREKVKKLRSIVADLESRIAAYEISVRQNTSLILEDNPNLITKSKHN